MKWQIYLTSQFQLNWWTEELNNTHNPVTWWDHIRTSACTPIPGLDAGGIAPELNQRLKFYCSWTWWVFKIIIVVFFFSFIIIVGVLFYFIFFFYFFSVLLTLPLLSSHSYPCPFHSCPFSFATIHCPPSQLSFCPFLSTLSPIFTSSSYLAPTCHKTTPASYILTTCWLAYCTNFTQPQPPAIPDTSTLHYTNRKTPKHTQGPQNPAAPKTLSSLTNPTSCLLF
jgi:hypothetical protein